MLMTPFEDDGLCQNLGNIKATAATAEDPFSALISLHGKEWGFHMAALILIEWQLQSASTAVQALEQLPHLRPGSAWEQPKGAPGPGATQGHREGDKPAWATGKDKATGASRNGAASRRKGRRKPQEMSCCYPRGLRKGDVQGSRARDQELCQEL